MGIATVTHCTWLVFFFLIDRLAQFSANVGFSNNKKLQTARRLVDGSKGKDLQ
jgi:hypothetical protein